MLHELAVVHCQCGKIFLVPKEDASDMTGCPFCNHLNAPTEDIKEILDYLWADEERYYEETEPQDQGAHIFEKMRRVSNWIEED